MSKNTCKKTSIGGQALIEGIMMRGPKKTVMSVRQKDGAIIREEVKWDSLTKKNKFFALPIIRGIVAFIESLVYGYKALMRSADLSGMLDEEEGEKKDSGTLMGVIGVVSLILGLALAIGLFIYLPIALFNGLDYLIKADLKPYKVVIESVVKIAIFIAYICSVALMKDVRRTFMYHGAEHKTIFCYEQGLPLSVENVRPQRRFHPRCGTSFMILMLIVSIVINFLLILIFPGFKNHSILWGIAKILMIPLICGIGYELIKFCGKRENLVTKIISAPGMWLQRATTKEPDDDMIEIAIDALKAVIPYNPEDDKL